MRFILYVDSNALRTDNFGNPATIKTGNAAQHPKFKKIATHYYELTQNHYVALGNGKILYLAPEVTTGGATAIDNSKQIPIVPGNEAISHNLRDIPSGTHEYLRISVSYQEYDVDYRLTIHAPTYLNNYIYEGVGRIASFVGFNTYITELSFEGFSDKIPVNSNQRQGFWAWITNIEIPSYNYKATHTQTGISPEGATTVVNPIASTSPIPLNSCVVTAKFEPPLVITGQENSDIKVKVTFSINNSFEWEDSNGNGKWDISSTGAEKVVDMGLRGMSVQVEK